MSSKDLQDLAYNQQSLLFGQYSLRVLTLDHAEPVLQLLSREFQDQQPMCNAFNKAFPVKDKEERLREWAKFYKLYEKHYLTNGLSVGVFDTFNKGELVGVIITKDQAQDYEGLQEPQMKDVNIMSLYSKVERQLKSRAGERYPSILAQTQPGVVLDCHSVAIKKEHLGKHLLQEMGKVFFNLPNLKKYRYLYSFITNPKSAVALKNARFQTIATVDVKQFQIEGVKYFEKWRRRIELQDFTYAQQSSKDPRYDRIYQLSLKCKPIDFYHGYSPQTKRKRTTLLGSFSSYYCPLIILTNRRQCCAPLQLSYQTKTTFLNACG